MYGRLRKNIGFSMIIFAFFFLFEPSYALIDPFPDFIGYSILCLALVNLADINERIRDSLKGFGKAAFLSLLRFVSLFITAKLFGEDENTIGQLIFVFVFAFFEIFVAIPAYKSLFEGLTSLATFHDGEAVFRKKREKGRSSTEKIYSLTSAFIAVKNVVCSLPEFTSLQTNSSYEFVHLLRIFAIVVVLPISIAWLISVVRYFISVKKDAGFVSSLSQKYVEYAAANPNFFSSRAVCTGLYAVLAACVLCFDIYSENVNYLPDLFLFGVLILAVIFLKKYSAKWVPITITSAFGCIISVLLYIVESEFFERHFIGAIKRDLEAYEHYYFMLLLYAIQAITLCAVIVLLTLFIKDIANKHVSGACDNKLSNSYKIRLLIFLGLGILSALSNVWHIFALPYFNRGFIYEYSGILSSACSIAFIVSAITLITYCVGEVKRFYHTDI